MNVSSPANHQIQPTCEIKPQRIPCVIENLSGNDLVIDDDDVRHREEPGNAGDGFGFEAGFVGGDTTEDISQNAKAKRLRSAAY